VRRADQIGIVVRDLESAIERYSATFDCTRWVIYTYGPQSVKEPTFRGGPGTYEMRLALPDSDPQVELIQPLKGPSLYHEWLDEHGEGLHHIGMRVPDLDEGIRERGYPVLQSGRGYGLDGDGGFAYLDTEKDLGVILELIEVPKRRREPEAVVEVSGANGR
jgi:methylmalonyl-CoA/ethylmalonyl-CoA epimerase